MSIEILSFQARDWNPENFGFVIATFFY